MTALTEYQRLECAGLWRPDPGAQRRDVIVSFGDATLILTDPRSDRAVAHWSLPAVERTNAGQMPALYRPGSDATEELELADESMVAAIGKVHRLLEARRPHPGRLRGAVTIALALGLGLAGVLWLPGALIAHGAAILPEAKRQEIGHLVMNDLARVSGAPCTGAEGSAALARLAERLGVAQLVVLPDAPARAIVLPGGIVAIGAPLVEQFASPDVAAGAIVAAQVAPASEEPLRAALDWAGARVAFQILTTGSVPSGAFDGYGTALVSDPGPPADPDLILARLGSLGLGAGPYAASLPADDAARARLIEAGGSWTPALDDGDWVALQGICER